MIRHTDTYTLRPVQDLQPGQYVDFTHLAGEDRIRSHWHQVVAVVFAEGGLDVTVGGIGGVKVTVPVGTEARVQRPIPLVVVDAP